MSTDAASKAELHLLVDELPEEKVETAKRFLQSLRGSLDTADVIARFLHTMDPDEAALLDGLAELDRKSGPPTADEPNHTQ